MNEPRSTIGQPVPELPVSDLERARNYYCASLGFEKRWALPEIAAVAREGAAIFFRLTDIEKALGTAAVYGARSRRASILYSSRRMKMAEHAAAPYLHAR
jgi:hypothetical protein